MCSLREIRTDRTCLYSPEMQDRHLHLAALVPMLLRHAGSSNHGELVEKGLENEKSFCLFCQKV